MKDAEGHIVARRELLEGTGFDMAGDPEHLSTFYISPGGTSERMELYLARVRRSDGILSQTGLARESEDIRTHVIPFQEALRMVDDGRIVDGKTILALLMMKDRLGR